MKNRIYKFTHIAAYLTMAHGAFYLVVKYFFQTATEYGPRPHIFQSYLQSAHIILSPLFIFAIGMLWKDHITFKFKNSPIKRFGGSGLFLASAVMIFSGYGIQSFYGEALKTAQVWIHLGSSLLFVFAYITHHVKKK